MTNERLREMMREIDEQDEYEVTEWEAQFLNDLLDTDFFTENQARVIIEIHERIFK